MCLDLPKGTPSRSRPSAFGLSKRDQRKEKKQAYIQSPKIKQGSRPKETYKNKKQKKKTKRKKID